MIVAAQRVLPHSVNLESRVDNDQCNFAQTIPNIPVAFRLGGSRALVRLCKWRSLPLATRSLSRLHLVGMHRYLEACRQDRPSWCNLLDNQPERSLAAHLR